MSPRARVLRFVSVLAALLSLAWLGTVIHFRRALAPIEAALVDDVAASQPLRQERRAWVDPPEPGWFGAELPAALDALREPLQKPLGRSLHDEPPPLRRLRREVAAGEKPFAALPPPWLFALDEGRVGLQALLLASRAAQGGLPEPLGPLGDPRDPLLADAWPLLRGAEILAALEVRRQLDEGAVPGAVTTCLGALAVGRELSSSGAVIGRMVAVGALLELVQPCAQALGRAIPEDRDAALAALTLLRETTPSFAAVMKRDNAGAQLRLFGGVASEPTQTRLPAWVRTRPGGAESGSLFVARQRLLLEHAWVRWSAWSAELLTAARYDDRMEKAVAAIDAECAGSWNPLLRAASPPDWRRLAWRHGDGLALLDLLIEAARGKAERTSSWPLHARDDDEPAKIVIQIRAR